MDIRDPYLNHALVEPPRTADAVCRRIMAYDLQAERQAFLATLHAFGAEPLDLDPQHVSLPVINRYLDLVMRRAV